MDALRLEDPAFAKGVFIPAAGVPVVRDAVRARLAGRLDAGDQRLPGVRRRRAAPPVRAPGDRRRPRAGHGAGQDPPRDPPRRAGPAADPAVPAVLRHARRDEPVPDRALVPLPLARRRRGAQALPAQRRGGDGAGSTSTATATATGSRSTRRARRTATTTRAGRTPATRSRTRMARSRRCRSRCASSRATSTTPSCGWPTSTRSSARRARAARLRAEANRLYERFNEAFWWESEGTYYLGLDGEKRPIESVASNAGHCLASGIVPPDRAERVVVKRLMARRHVVGLGDPDAVVRPRRLQPVQLPHGHGLAARQRDDRRRLPALRARRRGGPGGARACSTRPSGSRPTACPSCSPACPATRAASRSSTWARACPRRGRPASIFRLIAVLCGIHATTDPSGLAAVRRSGAARLAAGADDPQPARGQRDGRPAVPRPRRRVLSNTTGFEVIHGPAPRPTR